MDYEKKYKEALEKAKESYHRFEGKTVHYDLVKLDLEDMFPELKESEDERIRKALIENFKFFGGDRLETSKWGKDDDLLVTDIIAWLEKQGEQRPIDYNKELKKCRENPLYFFDKYVKLKLKKPVWSEEDEKMFRGVIAICDIWSTKTSFYPKENDDIEKLKNWLKSLKDRYTWKPSDEQIKELEFFIPYVTKCSVVLQKSKDTLLSLLSDLKKLKEK